MLLYRNSSRLIFQIIFFIVAVVEEWLLSGITFGWASIVVVFQSEGFFQDLCHHGKTNLTNNTMNSSLNHNWWERKGFSIGHCSPQSERFNLVFSISIAIFCVVMFPIGVFVDKYGSRLGQIVGCFLYMLAGFGLAFITKETSNLLFPIFILFCTGGAFIAISLLQLARYLFTDVRSLVVSLLHGAFDSSAVILLLFKLAWESDIKLRDISLFYIMLSFTIGIISLVLIIPSHNVMLEEWPTKSESHQVVSYEDTSDKKAETKVSFFETETKPNSLLGSIMSPIYLLELMFLSFCQLRLWFFIGSLDELITSIFPKRDAVSVDTYNSYFGYAQLCGFIVGPIIGFLFDRDTIKCRGEPDSAESEILLSEPSKYRITKIQGSVIPIFLTNLFCVGFSLLSLLPWKPGLIIAFILQVMGRGFLYAAHGAFIALAFEPQRFATLYGLGIFISGIFGLTEYVLYSIMYNWFNSDPFWINIALLILVLSANAFPVYLIHYCKKIKKKLGSKQ